MLTLGRNSTKKIWRVNHELDTKSRQRTPLLDTKMATFLDIFAEINEDKYM
jgi:hypothetical protein